MQCYGFLVFNPHLIKRKKINSFEILASKTQPSTSALIHFPQAQFLSLSLYLELSKNTLLPVCCAKAFTIPLRGKLVSK